MHDLISSVTRPMSTAPLAQDAICSPPLPDAQATTAEVAGLLRNGRTGEGVGMLEAARRGQPQAVQDALDRMVSAELGMSPVLDLPLGVQGLLATPSQVGQTLLRIQQAGSEPARMPDTGGLTDGQKFDVYASIVQIQGNAAAQDTLAAGERVILGLRAPNSTLDNAGRGVYDDRLVVLSRQANGQVQVEEFNRASTEPTAQYDGNLGADPRVANFRRAEGLDVTGDGIPELGRIRSGTMEMIETTHPNPASAGTDFSLRPSSAAVAALPRGVERDASHDGRFDAADVGGITPLNDTFKIHSGSRNNTDSAGCTTVHPDDYARLQRALTADPAQGRWQYVLTEVRS